MLTTTRSFQPATNHEDATATRPRAIRLLVVDDHPAVRVGLVQLLEASLTSRSGQCASTRRVPSRERSTRRSRWRSSTTTSAATTACGSAGG